ncbi:MAG: protein kinase, partial [Proteobacteria bacterium]|nr:protein kinase [Pseudomonadota bacterium]
MLAMAMAYDTNWDQISHLLDEVLDLPSEERKAYLASACADNPTLRREVETLLDFESEAQETIGESVMTFAPKLLPEADEILPPPAEMAEGERIGSYRIVRQLGQGGMGTVYLAQRADGLFEQAVAIKLIKRGFDTDDLLSRFTYERQILAALDHPNIARLYDGGMTSDGRPYFVMEYVDGVPLNDYCDHKRLTTKQRLALFRTVCRAVQYAHQNLIVHRDLKPSNILVTEDRTVKLLDFGIAKLLDDEATEQTAPVTRPGMRFMTPEYASPEQIEGGNPFDVRTDVYSLGVLMYHLITGQLPYHAEGPLLELARTIRETEPAAPSSLSANSDRKLDAIVFKALAKEKKSRYQSVEALANDLRRYLHGDTISARPITRTDRIWRSISRNPIAASFMIAVFLGLTGGIVHLSRLSGSLMEQTALETAKMYSDMLDRMNALYSSAVASPMRGEGIDVTHDFTKRSDAIPLPATFTIVLGENMRDCAYGMQLRLYSDYPFKFRTDGGPKDAFEHDALEQLRRNPEVPVYRFEDYDGRFSLRYATARRMDESCVACHNTHPDSTKRDWAVGDVRGVLEIIHPLENDVVRTRAALRGTFILVAVISGAFFCLSV